MSKDKRSVVTKYTTKVGSIEVPPNSTIELDRDEAEDKLRRGLVREPGGGNSEGDAARLKPEGDELVKAIAFKILELNKDDREAWTKDDKPNAKALAELLGYPITARERDEVVSYLEHNRDLLTNVERTAA